MFLTPFLDGRLFWQIFLDRLLLGWWHSRSLYLFIPESRRFLSPSRTIWISET